MGWNLEPVPSSTKRAAMTPRRRKLYMKNPISLARGLALVATLLCGMPAFGQEPPPSPATSTDRIQQLEQEVAALRAAIAELAKPEAPVQVPADRLAEVEGKIDVLAAEIEKLKIGEAAVAADQSDQGMGPAASKVYRTERGVSIGGYGEALYQKFDDSRDDGRASGRTDSADLLRAVVYFGYKWNDRLLFNSEVEFEHGGEEVGVEFAYLDYLWKPQANLRGGLLLVPMGFVNELHEPTVFHGAKRPDVERLILPSTWRENGFGLYGDVGPITYRTYLLNGFDASGFTAVGLRGGRQNGAEAKAERFAWVGRADYTALPGLLAGLSAYVGKAGQGEGAAVGTQIVEGHVEWKRNGVELRALGVQANLDDVARLNGELGLSGNRSVGERLTGGYLQAAYDLFTLFPQGDQALAPFARFESFDTQDRVPSGFAKNPANDIDVLTLGLTYKPIPQMVFKLDYQDYENGADTGIDQVNLAFGYVF